jgi:hypothetical protein
MRKKYWHKRLQLMDYYELTPEQQLEMDKEYELPEELIYMVEFNGNLFDVLDDYTAESTGSIYHGIKCVTNTCAYGVVVSKDSTEAVVQCFG